MVQVPPCRFCGINQCGSSRSGSMYLLDAPTMCPCGRFPQSFSDHRQKQISLKWRLKTIVLKTFISYIQAVVDILTTSWMQIDIWASRGCHPVSMNSQNSMRLCKRSLRASLPESENFDRLLIKNRASRCRSRMSLLSQARTCARWARTN